MPFDDLNVVVFSEELKKVALHINARSVRRVGNLMLRDNVSMFACSSHDIQMIITRCSYVLHRQDALHKTHETGHPPQCVLFHYSTEQ